MSKASFKWDDALLFDELLSDEERAVRDAAQAYCRTSCSRVC
jgi:glutaryl-CoA dehydrogenase